ncbi:Exodeoxyribonuclease VII small subunit [Singulisphaera sp. GP187]|uniref:exodeoxyribonuclease VII small subunit n=1 Tax=Singulisphaera sp. GP187 TaxID=1882752 RepID=UPI0009288EBC|nr:exodeoxyribonuclease VII small subunit [Singulisphaera sp. GP187]SIN68274.1 Exodeoxyribonuclease VII small subunit [Singulisphaera sp. GP187]
MSSDLDSTSFNKNYKVLKETADWLSGQNEPDIDQLVPKVEKAMKAYTICKDRLDKVQATLGQYFQQDGTVADSTVPVDGDGRVRKARKATRSEPDREDEDPAF